VPGGGGHLIYTSTFRIDTVQSESEVLVKVVKVEHAVRMLHGCRCTVDAPSYYLGSEDDTVRVVDRETNKEGRGLEKNCTPSLTVLPDP
jgi:hypothetical protein